MSTYSKLTKNPKTGEFEYATWMDDYFGRHHYGVKFPDGEVIDPEKVELETMDMPNNPSSNEDWEKNFTSEFGLELQNLQTRREVVEFIRTTRLEAQRSLAEEILDLQREEPLMVEGGVALDKIISVDNLKIVLSSRGLLPKITE
mgnify:CR=1 FL=1